MAHKDNAMNQDLVAGELDSSERATNLDDISPENDAYINSTFFNATENSYSYTGDDQATRTAFVNWHGKKFQYTKSQTERQYAAMQEKSTTQEKLNLIESNHIVEGTEKYDKYLEVLTMRAEASGYEGAEARSVAKVMLDARIRDYDDFYNKAHAEIMEQGNEVDRKLNNINQDSEQVGTGRATTAVNTISDTVDETQHILFGKVKFQGANKDKMNTYLYDTSNGNFIQDEAKAVQDKRVGDRKESLNAKQDLSKASYQYVRDMNNEKLAVQKSEDANHNFYYVAKEDRNKDTDYLQRVSMVSNFERYKEFNLEDQVQKAYAELSATGAKYIPGTKITLTPNSIRSMYKLGMYQGLTNVSKAYLFSKEPNDSVSLLTSIVPENLTKNTAFARAFKEYAKDRTFSQATIDPNKARRMSIASMKYDKLQEKDPRMEFTIRSNNKGNIDQVYTDKTKDYLLGNDIKVGAQAVNAAGSAVDVTKENIAQLKKERKEYLIKIYGVEPSNMVTHLGETFDMTQLGQAKRDVKKANSKEVTDNIVNGTASTEDVQNFQKQSGTATDDGVVHEFKAPEDKTIYKAREDSINELEDLKKKKLKENPNADVSGYDRTITMIDEAKEGEYFVQTNKDKYNDLSEEDQAKYDETRNKLKQNPVSVYFIKNEQSRMAANTQSTTGESADMEMMSEEDIVKLESDRVRSRERKEQRKKEDLQVAKDTFIEEKSKEVSNKFVGRFRALGINKKNIEKEWESMNDKQKQEYVNKSKRFKDTGEYSSAKAEKIRHDYQTMTPEEQELVKNGLSTGADVVIGGISYGAATIAAIFTGGVGVIGAQQGTETVLNMVKNYTVSTAGGKINNTLALKSIGIDPSIHEEDQDVVDAMYLAMRYDTAEKRRGNESIETALQALDALKGEDFTEEYEGGFSSNLTGGGLDTGITGIDKKDVREIKYKSAIKEQQGLRKSLREAVNNKAKFLRVAQHYNVSPLMANKAWEKIQTDKEKAKQKEIDDQERHKNYMNKQLELQKKSREGMPY